MMIPTTGAAFIRADWRTSRKSSIRACRTEILETVILGIHVFFQLLRMMNRVETEWFNTHTTMRKSLFSLLISGTLAALAHAENPAQQADAFFRQGAAAEKAGDPVAAKIAYTNALKVNPSHTNARYSLGQLKLNSESIAAQGREMKFSARTVPVYQLENASLQEALDALVIQFEKQEKDSAPNFMVEDPKGEFANTKISMNLKNVPAKAVMKYLTDQADAKVRFDEHAIVISPRNK